MENLYSNEEFGKVEFWKKQFKKEQFFDWYLDYQQLKKYFE